jgi:hypothetical protein
LILSSYLPVKQIIGLDLVEYTHFQFCIIAVALALDKEFEDMGCVFQT